MKILVLNHNIIGEGTWLRAWNVARELARSHDVEIATVSSTRRWKPHRYARDGCQVIEMPYWTSRRLAASGLSAIDIACRIHWMTRRPWDVLIGFSSLPSVGLPFLFARRRFPDRCGVSDWDDLFCDGGMYEYLNKGVTRPLYRFERWLEHTVRRRADLVTVTSRYLEQKARDIGVTAPILYLSGGADVDGIRPMDRAECRKRLELPENCCLVFYLSGGFSEDARLLLDAFALAAAEDRSLLLVMSGDMKEKYRREINRLKLTERVLLTGRIRYEEVPWYLGAADILAMPLQDTLNSRARGPIKLRDYLCAGRPIVGSALGEVKEIMSRHDVGLLADASHESFARALMALARAPDRRERMGTEARRVAEKLSWRNMVDSLETALQDVAGSGKR